MMKSQFDRILPSLALGQRTVGGLQQNRSPPVFHGCCGAMLSFASNSNNNGINREYTTLEFSFRLGWSLILYPHLCQ